MKLETEVVKRLLQDAGSRADRWAQLVEVIADVSPTTRQSFLVGMATVDVGDWSEHDRGVVSDRIRTVLAHHRGFPDAVWVLPVAVLDRLTQLSERFASRDALRAVAWLFSLRAQLPEEPNMTWNERESAVSQARADAILNLHHAGGLPRVVELACMAETRWLVGVALADADLVEDPFTLACQLLHVGGSTAREVAHAALIRSVDKHGADRIRSAWREILDSGMPADWLVLFLLALPFDATTWTMVKTCDRDLQRLYWTQLVVYGRGELDHETVRTVAEALYDFGQETRALEFLAIYRRQAEASQVLRILEAASSPERIRVVGLA